MIAPQDDPAAIARVKASLSRTYAFELSRAEFYRGYRADLATRLRSGLVGLNCASALGLATLYGTISAQGLKGAGLQPQALLAAFVLYAFGALLAGWAINAQYVDAINAEGDASTRAIHAGMALDWVDAPPGSGEDGHTKEALKTVQATPYVRSKHDQLAISFQAISWGLWGTGTLTLALSIAAKVTNLSAVVAHFAH